MSAFWLSEDGWPYPDGPGDEADPAADPDEDLLTLRVSSARLLAGLDPVEREVVAARFGLGGASVRSMRQLHHDLGVPRAELRGALGSGLAKIRSNLQA